MADRSISYTLAARVAPYVSAMAEAAAVTELLETKQKQLTVAAGRASAAQAAAAGASTTAVSASSTSQITAHARTAVAAREAGSAASSAAAQTVASAQQAAAATTAGSAAQQAAHTRSAASLREKLGLQALEGTAAERSAAANSRAAASAAVFNAAIERGTLVLGQETGASAASTAATRTNTVAREQATVAARAQQAATGALTSANGLLGTSLSPLTAGVGAAALGLGYAAFRGMEFDSAMSEVQASSGATGTTLDGLRNLAIDLGADTKYSGEEAAQGISELAKAGVSTSDIMSGALAGSLDLAAAGNLEVGQAAEIAATQLTVFNLSGSQASHVADLLAAGAGKAQGSVEDMALALQYAGLPAAGLGLSIEETTGAIALFASNGLTGEKAGTSFRGMLTSMTNPVGKTRELMADLNLEFFDAQGQFIGMDGVADQLQTQLGGLTDQTRNAALAQIFGNEALGAAQILYNSGASGVDRWTSAVDDAGYAQDYAATLSDNLRGDLERLGGAFDAGATQVGAFSQGTLRFLVQSLTAVIDAGGDVIGWITDLPGPLQAAAAGVLALYLVTGPLAGVIATAGSNLLGLAGRAAGAAVGVGGLTGAVTVARTAILGMLGTVAPFLVVAAAVGAITRMVEVSNSAEEARDHIDELTAAYDSGRGPERYQALAGALDSVGTEAAAARTRVNDLADDSFWEQFWSWDYAGDVEMANNALDAATDRLDELDAASARADQNVSVLGRRYNMTRSEVEDLAAAHGIDLSGSLQIVQGDFIRVADAADLAATGVTDLAGGLGTGYESLMAYADALEMSDDATEELRKYTDELGESLSAFVDPLGVYTGLIDAKKTAEQESAQATADATEDQSDSWEDYVGDVQVSVSEYLTTLQEQVAAQDAWQTNMLILSSRVSQGTIDELARMGPEGAPLVAQLVTASDAELAQMETSFAQRSSNAASAWGEQLLLAQPVLSQIAATAGQGVADSLAAELAAGTTTVGQIAADYGIAIATGVNPILSAVGKNTIVTADLRASNPYYANRAQGGAVWGAGTATSDSIPARLSNGEYVIRASSVSKYGLNTLDKINQGVPEDIAMFADGGIVDLGRRLQKMGARVAEHPAFPPLSMTGHGRTSLHYTGHAIDVNTRAGTSALEQSELAPMAALARSLGFRTIFMAPGHYNHLHADDGGGPNMGSAGSSAPAVVLPTPPSTAPFGPPISTTADGAMASVYDGARSFLASIGPATTSLSGSSVPAGERGGSGVRALGQQIAAQMGFGAQFPAIDSIFTRESGWNPTAQNPTSTAYGIPQFLNATWRAYGGKTSDPAEQIRDGIRYMVDRYGSPNGAKAFWDRNHWYSGGGHVEAASMASYESGTRYVPRTGPATLHEGERVLTREQNRVVTSREMAGVALGAGGGTTDARQRNTTINVATVEDPRQIARVIATTTADNEFLAGVD